MNSSLFDYQAIQPISNPIEPQKQGAKRHWGSHPYFTRRAWNVVQKYIRTFSQPGDTILDPLYMENKLVYSFSNLIADSYIKLSNQSNLNLENTIQVIQSTLSSPSL